MRRLFVTTLLIAVVLAVATWAADWTKVAEWSGSGTKETESVDITTREWRIVWKAAPTDAAHAFTVMVMNSADTIVSSISAGPDEVAGESYVRGTGRYYLKITSINTKWTIRIEQQ